MPVFVRDDRGLRRGEALAVIMRDALFGRLLAWREARRVLRTEDLVGLGSEVVHARFERDSGHPGQSGPMNPEDVDDLVYEVLKAVGTVE